ncbi:MAG TPA: hypothetical protein VLV86_24475 [Vicinamibacterales bacterium]|nr:hypothetical protein [Vicinamibacterales bacterium]
MNRLNAVVGIALLAASVLMTTPRRASAQDLSLTFRNHRVTLLAKDVTVSRILERWAQIGGTAVVNGETIQSRPVTLQLVDVPEREALDVVLRSVDSYIVAERMTADEGVSVIDRILVMKSASAMRNVAPTAPPPMAFAPGEASAVVSDTPFATNAPNRVPPPRPPVAGTAAAFAGQGIMPMAPASSGSARPGDATPQLPPFSSPSTAPTSRPGEAPAPKTIRQSAGPRLPQQ